MILTVTLNASVDKSYVVDHLDPYKVMRVKEVNNTAGGKGLNVSRVAALAGEPVTAMGFIGGHNGRLFESLIFVRGIEKRFTHINAETRCCINVRDLATNKSTEFLEPGSLVTEDDLAAFLHDFETQLPLSRIVTISGSMPKGVPADFYGLLVELARRAGKPVLLDSSGEALRAALSAYPTFIKPNADEICQLLGKTVSSRQEVIAAARQLHDGGVDTVAVSLGRDGVLVVSGEGVYRGITPNVPVVNTVGCGDSMVAGFAVGLARGMALPERIRYAVAISTANALTQETGSFRGEDLEALLPQIQVERLSAFA
ncbi:1-phosphofructokinase [Marasmitruncus massiliensis]|uniref:1-phosphofructokinase n=1 Tax=Marasmitruncus massiliensis TaxID=1944642 RepID=UPI000C7D03C4|nr:1-phosphofructokinase [Marasmitruncus massiliensis]MBE6906410.1 1-phosphofructokinase [Oscillospiraceae bacterium]